MNTYTLCPCSAQLKWELSAELLSMNIQNTNVMIGDFWGQEIAGDQVFEEAH